MEEKKGKAKGMTGQLVITPRGRVSFPSLKAPNTTGEFPDNKYKVTLLFDKKTSDMSGLRKAMMDLAKKAWPNLDLKKVKWAVGDGDTKVRKDGTPTPGYAGNWYLTAKSTRMPGCVDHLKRVIDPIEVYGGCYAHASVTPGTYESTETVVENGVRKTATLHGVTLYLNNVQKVADGQPMGGPTGPAGSEFDVVDASEDQSNYVSEPAQGIAPPAKAEASSSTEDEMPF